MPKGLSYAKFLYFYGFFAVVLGLVGLVAFNSVQQNKEHCADVRKQGAQLKLIAESSSDLARQVDATYKMLDLALDNKDCFTKAELAKVKIGEKILKEATK